jgi:(1->4)-alpha-D-glucan 1-alpha-D-glucosylmutase
MSTSRAPASTYRLQLHAGFGFAGAAGVTDYLDALGVDAVYTSPYLQARAGSSHGYDVVEHSRVSRELGGEPAFVAWTDELRARGLGHVLDVVPNHMGIGGGDNAWWTDLLESGPASRYDGHFDVAWDPPGPGMRGKLLLPVLGRQFGEALEAGELRVVRAGGALQVAYHERRLPLALSSVAMVLRPALARCELSADDPALAELHSVLTALGHLPGELDTAPDGRDARAREVEVIKRRLAGLCETSPPVAAAIDEQLAALGGTVGEPRSFDALEAVLQAQVYRLCYWRVATEEINYRRFFDVNDLAAIKMEDPAVFAAAHARVFEWISEGRISGLRVDHTDGLLDPAAYFAAVRAATGGETNAPWLVIEKILGAGELLPEQWPVDGTTGYDFLTIVNGLWIAPEAGPRLTDFYRRFTGLPRGWAATARAARLTVLRSSLASEIHMLADKLGRIAAADRRSRDFTRVSLTRAIAATIADFPVYRTYVHPEDGASAEDVAHVDRAIRRAGQRRGDVDASVFEFLRDVLLLRRLPEDPERRAEVVDFALRFAQLTGPVIAKGVEDTAFYRYNRMVGLNEVGGEPGRFGTTVAEFHAHNERQRRRFPRTMTTTATHDTKRGEDLRARLAVLTEIPDPWRRSVSAWARLARLRRTTIDGRLAPSRNDTYLFYQTVVGAFPLAAAGEALPDEFIARIADYMAKATKEAKLRTSWLQPDEAYDAAVQRFTREMLAHPQFVAQARALAAEIASHGAVNSLAQLCIKIASPGVPDFYQGCELWDFSLVDPDNRRPVDFAIRQTMLAGLRGQDAPSPAALLASFLDGRIKLLISHRGLRHRREHRDLYLDGSYEPIQTGRHLIAFRRGLHGPSGRKGPGAQELVCVVPRLTWTLTGGRRPWPLADVWGEQSLELGAGPRIDLFTGARHEGASLRVADVLRDLPVALLWRSA